MDDTKQNHAMALSAHLIGSLDLNSLPERLNDEMMGMVRTIADGPLPALPPCSDRHIKKSLRVMLAVLPKRTQDEISGELFLAAYLKKLQRFSEDQISFLANSALERCKWFPTIAECIEIIDDWRRSDDAVERQRKAVQLLRTEENNRIADRSPFIRIDRPDLTQEMVDAMSPQSKKIGLEMKRLRIDDDGTVRPWFSKPGEEIVF